MSSLDLEYIEHLAFENNTECFKSYVDNLLTEAYKRVDNREEILFKILSLLDITTLNDDDYRLAIEKIVSQTVCRVGQRTTEVAGVCVYSDLITFLEKYKLPKVKKVVVSGGFPTSRLSLPAKLCDIDFALQHHADEIDIPLDRALFFENRQELEKQLREIRKTIDNYPGAKLKVILETSELKSFYNVYSASKLAIENGADFVKTSTGKFSRGADLYSSVIMLLTIKKHFEATSRLVGFKAAGGIRQAKQATDYYLLYSLIVGEKYICPDTFRIGCSNLRDNIINQIK